MNKEEAAKGLIVAFKNALLGETDFFELAGFTQESICSIREYMFIRKLKIVVNELISNDTVGRKIGEILARSNYGEEYGYTLLHYIETYEHVDKGRIMAYFLDATSKEFITPDECFRFCKILADVSLSSLCFLKQNITKRVLYKINMKDKACVHELLMYDLMYRSENNGYAFSLTAHFIDKYGLSYTDEERYKNYTERMGDIPALEKFPKVPESIVTEGSYYEG